MTPVLSVKDLVKNFGSFQAVKGITFDVMRGSIVGFLGPNGAGKTTTVHMLLNFLTPSSGRIEYFGKSFSGHLQESLRKVGYASAYSRLPGRLTVHENLLFFARMYELDMHYSNARIDYLLNHFGIERLRNQYAGSLSAGQLTLVMICKAFLHEPSLLILDEPTASLDPDVAVQVLEFIEMQRSLSGISVLFTSHKMDEVAQLCDDVIVLQQGDIVARGAPDELAAKVSLSSLHLTIADPAKLLALCHDWRLDARVQGDKISIALAESHIAQLLQDITAQGILYRSISIDKPTLEDYFLAVARGGE